MFWKPSLVLACLLLLSVTPVLAQDFCEGNFDYDLDQDSYDAAVFKTDFGRSPLGEPCPAIDCYTAEQLEIQIAQLQTQVAQLTALLANVTRSTVDGQDTIRFSNMNVQIVNGSGDTSGTVNGRGNLIVGYNELRSLPYVDDRSGSHNIVVGSYQNYSSAAGLMAGSWNTISAPYTSISGGSGNVSSSAYASVSGGAGNTASGGWSSVSGGVGNEASYYYASVSGGASNTASGEWASVSGGQYNEASGGYSSVSGGRDNVASRPSTSISGGRNNIASGDFSSVSGGRNNQGIGEYSFIGGGGDEMPAYGNYAVGNYSAILGGSLNTAGDSNHTDTTIGPGSSVCGGQRNTASGSYSSVSGGFLNTASGGWSSVSGGNSRSVTGLDDWRAGSCYFCDN